MRKFNLFCLSLLTSSILSFADTSSIDAYVEYIERYPLLGPLGNAGAGELEIILDKEKIAEIEKSTGRLAGVVAQDNYWLWLNDPLKFPKGTYGIYGRLIWKSSLDGPAGVAVMATLPNGKIVLNRNFRHATRSWEYELPRGKRDNKETAKEAAIREAKEETGMVIDQLHLLGEMLPDSGVTNTVLPVFFAKVKKQEATDQHESEAIAGIEAFTIEELKKGFVDGYLTVTIDGTPRKVHLRDPFLAYALLQVECQGLLKKK